MFYVYCGVLLLNSLNSNIDKTEREIRKVIREESEAAIVPLPYLSDLSFDDEMEDVERITLRDYGRLDNIDDVAQGFQLANPVFDIKM